MKTLRKGRSLFLAFIASSAASASLQAAATSYTLTDLGAQRLDSISAPSDLNDYKAPQVDNSGAIHFGSGRSEAGNYVYQNSYTAAPSNGQFKPGQVVQETAYSQTGTSRYYAYVYPSGGASASNSFTYAGGINSDGIAVGWSDPSSHTAFVLRPTGAGQAPAMSIIPGADPGTVAWYALGINASGLIVGQTPPPGSGVSSSLNFGIGRAFISDGSTTTDLNTLIAPGSGFLLTSATSINDLGQIAGFDLDAADDSIHAYLLTPTATPEPGAWAVALSVSAFVGLRRAVRRRKSV